MNEYALIAPPNCAGVYALRNKATKQLYIGESLQLASRWAEWRLALRGSAPSRSARMRAVFGDTTAEDWVFVVLAEMPGATKKELIAAERKAIARVTAHNPDRVLNTMLPCEKQKREGDTRLTRVTYQGRELTYREVAEILGVTKIAVKTKLAKLRAKGVNDVSVDQLYTRKNK